LVGVLQSVYRQLPEALQARWQERLADYLSGRPHQVCYRIKANEQEQHLQTLGDLLSDVAADLAETAPEHPALELAQRVLAEQFELDAAGAVHLRPAKDVASDSLQSPHDPDATYRVKGGKRYRGGYVVNVSETAEPDNPVQLLTDVQVEPNQTDDVCLMEQALAGQQERGIEVERVTTDGGFTGPTGEAVCEEHEVELRATHMRGDKSSDQQWGWEQYQWERDADGTPLRVTCPQGVTADLHPGQGVDRYIARFARDACESCPLKDTRCRIRWGSRVGPSLYVSQQIVAAAVRRQRLCPEDAGLRAVVEATVRELKHPFAGGKLPVRGLIRARMVIYGGAMMVNLRRLHRYVAAKRQDMHSETPVIDDSAPGTQLLRPSASVMQLSRLQAGWTRLQRCFAGLWRRFAFLPAGAC
jgi:hypothetical protein